jgi:uncharacterized RDD family membrane protein YckC
MNCTRCGGLLEADARFCGDCGAPVAEANSSQTVEQVGVPVVGASAPRPAVPAAGWAQPEVSKKPDGQEAATSWRRSTTPPQMVADKWVRTAGYLIDILPTLLTIPFAWLPFIGIVLAGVFLTPYWLLRDITGASLGKLLLGLRVVGRDGRPATVGGRIIRNLPLALGPSCMLVPFLGYIFAGPVAGVVVLVEGVMLLSQGERLGDRLARTRVVRK